MNDPPIYIETRDAILIDPQRPIALEWAPRPQRVDWFADRTDIHATQAMPAATPRKDAA